MVQQILSTRRKKSKKRIGILKFITGNGAIGYLTLIIPALVLEVHLTPYHSLGPSYIVSPLIG